jgi:hypothetical protein
MGETGLGATWQGALKRLHGPKLVEAIVDVPEDAAAGFWVTSRGLPAGAAVGLWVASKGLPAGMPTLGAAGLH